MAACSAFTRPVHSFWLHLPISANFVYRLLIKSRKPDIEASDFTFHIFPNQALRRLCGKGNKGQHKVCPLVTFFFFLLLFLLCRFQIDFHTIMTLWNAGWPWARIWERDYGDAKCQSRSQTNANGYWSPWQAIRTWNVVGIRPRRLHIISAGAGSQSQQPANLMGVPCKIFHITC